MSLRESRSSHHVGLSFLEVSSREDDPYSDRERLIAGIRSAVTSGGLSNNNPHTPFEDIIQPGDSVLLKPNWVHHVNGSGAGLTPLITHREFVLATIKEISKARPGQIIVGDAPIQDCKWSAIIDDSYRDAMMTTSNCATSIRDFRRTVIKSGGLSEGVTKRRTDEDYVRFDLGERSFLEPVTSRIGNPFRVTRYDPRSIGRAHQPGRHQYEICREFFEADCVISMPKLKTHSKAGLSGALKNLVGINGSKDFLPHHRVGGSYLGGDCYEGLRLRKRIAELCLDIANRHIGTQTYDRWSHRAYQILERDGSPGYPNIEGGWHGNDTVWRMALDIQSIALYGTSDGKIADHPQRRIHCLTDGVVAGEGEGPLASEPLLLKTITFGSSAPHLERVHATLMHFDWTRIPIVLHSFEASEHPLAPDEPPEIVCDGLSVTIEELLDRVEVRARPPAGWIGHIEAPGTPVANPEWI